MFSEKGGWYSLSLLLAAVIVACASPRSPTGGPKDELPPRILESESTPNQQTHFNEKEIIITFDEWVTLKDIRTQLVVSPLMPDEPEIKQKGKAVIITLPDSLREETTYTLNFGNAIADLNEGNILENFSFVFSTGSVLDSVRLSGRVMNAVSLQPAEGIWVMLHSFEEDSAVYKRKPDYLAKTNKDGVWSIGNIRPDSFAVTALKDENLNFLYDQETELFGWQDEAVVTNTPSAILPPIFVFPREKNIAITEVIHTTYGWLKMIVTAPMPKPMPTLVPEPVHPVKEWEKDTLHVWYAPQEFYSGMAILGEDTTWIKVALNPSAQKAPFRIKMLSGRLPPTASVLLGVDIPIDVIDSSRITVMHDSLGPIPFVVRRDSAQLRQFEIKASWKEQSRHVVTFLPGAIKDIWGRENDTIRHSIVVNSADQFGDLTINLEGLDSTLTYLVLIKSGEQIAAEVVIDRLAKSQIKQYGMSPAKYGVDVIEDLNRNGTWDTGDYAKRRQPEKKRIFALESLRAGWELEADLKWE